MNAERFHRWVRALVRVYPYCNGAALVSRIIGRFIDVRRPLWLPAAACGRCPSMVLNVSRHLQRKTYYFPRAYGGYYLGSPLRSLLDERLRPGHTFLDIGANLGFFSLHAAHLVSPGGSVAAFEPDPETCESLSRSAQLNGIPHLRAFEVALSDRDGTLSFQRHPGQLSSSLVESGAGHGTIDVRATSLDRLIAAGELALERVDLIKVDVEGEEPRTVAGMRDTLARFGRPPVWCEVRGPRGSSRAPDTLSPVSALLAELGYRPFKHDGRSPRRPLTARDILRRGSQDVLFEPDGPR